MKVSNIKETPEQCLLFDKSIMYPKNMRFKKVLSHTPEDMDGSFEEIIKPSLTKYDLWKLGVYYTTVIRRENNERGMCLERFFCEELNAEDIDDFTVNALRKKGTFIKYDFILPNKVPINVKTTFIKDGLFDIRNNMTSNSSSIKVFDTSRRKYKSDHISALKDMLTEIDWDVVILLYGFEISTNRCCLCLTSLKEICYNIFGEVSEGNILMLFNWGDKGSHYFINRVDIFNTAKKNKRLIWCDPPTDMELNEYSQNKIIPPMKEIIF